MGTVAALNAVRSGDTSHTPFCVHAPPQVEFRIRRGVAVILCAALNLVGVALLSKRILLDLL